MPHSFEFLAGRSFPRLRALPPLLLSPLFCSCSCFISAASRTSGFRALSARARDLRGIACLWGLTAPAPARRRGVDDADDDGYDGIDGQPAVRLAPRFCCPAPPRPCPSVPCPSSVPHLAASVSWRCRSPVPLRRLPPPRLVVRLSPASIPSVTACVLCVKYRVLLSLDPRHVDDRPLPCSPSLVIL